MPTPKPPYPAEFRRQMVELVQSGRKPTQLAREFNVTAQSISTWVAQVAADSGKPARGKDVLSSAEREELARLRRENKRLQQERDILAKARPGSP
jgi:transposase